MYADNLTGSMRYALEETERRRTIQKQYNAEHGITPQTIRKEIYRVPEATKVAEKATSYGSNVGGLSSEEKENFIRTLEEEMQKAAKELDFERAAELRDTIIELKGDKPMTGRTANDRKKKGPSSTGYRRKKKNT
jgi:excinuclease ABC subunit B